MKEVTEACQHSPFLEPYMSVVLLHACSTRFSEFTAEAMHLTRTLFGAWGQSRIIEDANGRLRDLESRSGTNNVQSCCASMQESCRRERNEKRDMMSQNMQHNVRN
eukprot:6492122-Amphidinium_carterae.1